MNLCTNGLGGTLGATIATLSPLYVGGSIVYVHSSGDDSNTGVERQKPKKTLAQAAAVATAGTIIVILAGHRELLTATATIAAGALIVGEGEGLDRPVIWSPDDVTTLTLQGANVLANIGMDPAVAKLDSGAASAVRINAAQNLDIDGLVVSIGDLNGAVIMTMSGDSSSMQSVRNSSFAVSRSATAFGFQAIKFSSSGVIAMDNVILDGGEQGYGVPAVARLANTDAAAYRLTNMVLLNGADISLLPGGSGSAAVGYVHVSTSSGMTKVLV